MMNLLQIARDEYGEFVSRIPIWLFNITFGIGTLILVLALVSSGCDAILIIGSFYTLIALIINAVAFVLLMILSFAFTSHSNVIRLNTLLLLINIPVAILYIFIIISVINLFKQP